MSPNLNLNTADSIGLYAFIDDKDNFLSVPQPQQKILKDFSSNSSKVSELRYFKTLFKSHEGHHVLCSQGGAI